MNTVNQRNVGLEVFGTRVQQHKCTGTARASRCEYHGRFDCLPCALIEGRCLHCGRRVHDFAPEAVRLAFQRSLRLDRGSEAAAEPSPTETILAAMVRSWRIRLTK